MLVDFIKRGFYFEEPNDGSSGGTAVEEPTAADGQAQTESTSAESATTAEPATKQEPVVDTTKRDREVARLKSALQKQQEVNAAHEERLKQFTREKPEVKTINDHPALRGVAVDEDGYVMMNGVQVTKEFYVKQVELQNEVNFNRELAKRQLKLNTMQQSSSCKAHSLILPST